MSYLRRHESSSSPGRASGSSAVSAADCKELPALAEFLTAAEWPDGSTRETGTLLVFTEAGAVKVCLNDRAQGLVQFTTAPSLLGALGAAEQVLVEADGDWRPTRRNRR